MIQVSSLLTCRFGSHSFNPTLNNLHRNLNDLLQEKADMQSRLRTLYGKSSLAWTIDDASMLKIESERRPGLEALELKSSFNNSPSLIYVPKKKQTDFSLIRQDPEMAVLNETAKTVRTFVYNVSLNDLPMGSSKLIGDVSEMVRPCEFARTN